uniref:Uncharacterized protein n=1 Tax=Musca domestica TaxID=7370 RepID=A0A1I8N731_MUSDO
MSAITNYQHKKFNVRTQEYHHKKFTSIKRKFDEIEKEEITLTADIILQQANKDITTELPQIKRKQTKPLFRPWEDKEEKSPVKRPSSCPPTEMVSSKTSNMLAQDSNPKRRRNTVGALMRRRQQQQQAEQRMRHQQYIAYQQQQQYNAAVMEQSMRNSVYLAYLQLARQQQSQQQQLFVFGLQS